MQDSKHDASSSSFHLPAGLYDPGVLVIGQIRRFGDAGPAYEIVGFEAEGKVSVEVVYSNERVQCSADEILADPIAETIP
jgi:hypothetical protein